MRGGACVVYSRHCLLLAPSLPLSRPCPRARLLAPAPAPPQSCIEVLECAGPASGALGWEAASAAAAASPGGAGAGAQLQLLAGLRVVVITKALLMA